MAVYCLRGPKGKLYEGTVRGTSDEAWVEAFGFLCQKIPGFEEAYWKRWDESRKAAKALGWTIVQCNLTVRQAPR